MGIIQDSKVECIDVSFWLSFICMDESTFHCIAALINSLVFNETPEIKNMSPTTTYLTEYSECM